MTTHTEEKALLNVRDFGAVGDGVTNDFAAFERAIKAAQEQGTGIVCDGGTFRLESPTGTGLNIPSYSRIVGALITGTHGAS